MRTLIAIGLAVLFVVSVSFLLRARSKKQAQTRPDVYDGLRAQVLKGTRSSFDLAPTSAPMVPWGVVMDWGVSEGSATVVALSDGHASIYLSSGGGYLGGSQSHESNSQRRTDSGRHSRRISAADEINQHVSAATPQRGYLLSPDRCWRFHGERLATRNE